MSTTAPLGPPVGVTLAVSPNRLQASNLIPRCKHHFTYSLPYNQLLKCQCIFLLQYLKLLLVLEGPGKLQKGPGLQFQNFWVESRKLRNTKSSLIKAIFDLEKSLHLNLDVSSEGKIDIICVEKNLRGGEMLLPIFSENGLDGLQRDCVTILASLKHKSNDASSCLKPFACSLWQC